MADILREITAWILILTGLATCLSAGAALLMHITTQWLWEKLKAAYSLKELSDAVRAWKRQKNTGDTEQ
ncbi:hypothetical protein SHX68_004271 [Escherichia coli]|uniref:hypothetical protein n=1 Tax=Escherichia coli TaxID=562 RepID=UPI0010087009|nr:hypothetical protein [Escherichia coli]EHS5545752.1 hypothetical protein [Escherichia coli]EIK0321493.1 hypothetical protein [Escherichia coli]EKI3106585.1 hypothetical protein [Escherichia coli]ELK4545571.1 hypothetical protein [Escherichia coli]ELW0129899.1 hypothetical protein [Escherichia coli]